MFVKKKLFCFCFSLFFVAAHVVVCRLTAKIGDFGLSRALGDGFVQSYRYFIVFNSSHTHPPLTGVVLVLASCVSREARVVDNPRWVATEILSRTASYSLASECYAYGLVIWEVRIILFDCSFLIERTVICCFFLCPRASVSRDKCRLANSRSNSIRVLSSLSLTAFDRQCRPLHRRRMNFAIENKLSLFCSSTDF